MAHWGGKRVAGASYEATVAALASDSVPNLLLLHYTDDWRVRDLLLIPSFMFSISAVEPRPPLSSTARRAGWIGCNIRLDRIPPEGRIVLVRDFTEQAKQSIREEYDRLRPLRAVPASLRGWALDVLSIVDQLGEQFTLHEVY